MQVSVLDHGYVRFVEAWGTGHDGKGRHDSSPDLEVGIIEAARMSTARGFEGWGKGRAKCKCGWWSDAEYTACPDDPTGHTFNIQGPIRGDEKLLAFLYNNKHATPFEMAGMTLEIKAPIFVFREWHRHRTQSYNEMSARYTPLPDENYVPALFRIQLSGGSNKQAQGMTELQAEHAQLGWIGALKASYQAAQEAYEIGLRNGIPKELARLSLPVARYSRMRASANLRNWLAFLTLRMAPNAQWEIRQYANAVGEIVSQHFPRTWELFKGEADDQGK